MSRIYLILNQDGLPLLWRLRDTLPEVRIYEAGIDAVQYGELAVKLKYLMAFTLFELDSVPDAREYIDFIVKEPVWVHLYPLALGYKDTYAYNKKQ